tara:strand:+ start:6251 stop:6370 length:120 start_codon:yes stop_codon:yes gene_type:complete
MGLFFLEMNKIKVIMRMILIIVNKTYDEFELLKSFNPQK